ncbi:lipopolysaccharide biosynthesis protein [Roseomonas sp. GCM10028921]
MMDGSSPIRIEGAARPTRERLRAAVRKGIAPATAFGMRLCAAAMAYLTFALIGRVTDIEGFSRFALVFSAVGFLGPVSSLGQDALLLRNLPGITADGDRGWRDLVRSCARTLLLGIAIWGSIGLAYGLYVLGPSEPWLVALLVALTASNGILELLFAIQRGCGSILPGILSREILWRVTFIAGISVLWFFQTTASATMLALAYLLGLLTSMAAFLAYVIPRWIRAGSAQPGPAADQSRPSAGAYFGINLIGHATPQIDMLVLGLTIAHAGTEIGAYFSAQRIIQILYFFAYGIAITITPQIPLAWQRRDIPEMVRLSRTVSRGAGACVLLVSIGLMLFAGPLLGLFKPEFSFYGHFLVILALGPLFSTLGGLHTVIAPMCGGEVAYLRLRIAVVVTATVLKVIAGFQGSLILFAAISATEAALTAAVGVILARSKLSAWPV